MRPAGVLVDHLHPESNFARAGIESGDVLLSIGGAEINAPSELAFRTATLGTGRSAELRYLRAGQERSTTVSLAPAPEQPPRDITVLQNPSPLRGVTVMNVNPAVIDQYQLPLASSGILVAGVEGRGRRSGLRPGDLILAVNNRPVGDVRALEVTLRRGGRLVLSLERDGARGNLEVGE